MALGGADNLARSPELRTKLLWTLGLLCAYRIGVHIPVPGVDGGALAHFFESVAGTLFGLFDMFSGGGLRNVSVFALGIMPYISASIILQLLQVVSPELKRMARKRVRQVAVKSPSTRATARFLSPSFKASALPWALKPCTAPAAFPSSSNRAGPSAS